MRKLGVFVLVLLCLSLFSFVLAEEGSAPSVQGDINEGDVKAIQDAVDYVPISDSGEFDSSKFSPQLSKAEERINAINQWLDDNVSWMRYIFWMKPEISWLFAFNIYFILFFIVTLILNSEGIWFFLEKKGLQYFFGIALFVVFMVSGLYVGLAGILEKWRIYIFDVMIPASIFLAILVIVVSIALLIAAYPFAQSIILYLKNRKAAKKLAKEKMEMAMNSKIMNKFIEEATK